MNRVSEENDKEGNKAWSLHKYHFKFDMIDLDTMLTEEKEDHSNI